MIVITGGAGFIGSNLLAKLNRQGIDNILIVDNLGKSGKWKNLIGQKFIDYVHKDIFRDNLILGDYDDQIEAIFHFGACSDTTETDMDYLMDNNLAYSKELAEYAVENNVRFIYASSAATYGNGEHGYSDSEFDKLKPLNGYGFSKHLFDLWVLQNGYDSKFIGLKFFNVFGANEYHKGSMASMIYKSFAQIKDNGYINLFASNSPEFEDGEQMRDFIYIKDAIEVIWKLYNDKSISGIFNLGTGQANTWNDLARNAFKSLKLKEDIRYVAMPGSISKQYQNYTQADMGKLNSKVKHDFTEFEDSVDDYFSNYLSL